MLAKLCGLLLIGFGLLELRGQSSGKDGVLYTHAPDGAEPWPVNDLYFLGPAESTPRPLTTDGHSHHGSWSPDGSRILFIHDAALSSKPPYTEQPEYASHHPIELSVMNADGSNRQVLQRIEPVIYSAGWSPDGKTIAISCATPHSTAADTKTVRAGLYLLPANGQGELRMLYPNGFSPAWSPDGRKLAFSVEQPRGKSALHVMNTDGTQDTALTSSEVLAGSPAWSPDGAQIAFVQESGQSGEQIFVMQTDGSKVRQITSDPAWTCRHPSWSTDGERLVFACRSAGIACGGVSSIGTILPPCKRRLFSKALAGEDTAPVAGSEHDAADPAVSPVH